MSRTLYRLDAPVQNPKPDRRCKDWPFLLEFPTGIYVLHTDKELLRHITRLTRTGERVVDHDDDPRFNALFPKLVPHEPQTLQELLTLFWNVNEENLFRYFIKSGKLNFDDLKAAAQAIDAMTQEEYDAWESDSL